MPLSASSVSKAIDAEGASMYSGGRDTKMPFELLRAMVLEAC